MSTRQPRRRGRIHTGWMGRCFFILTGGRRLELTSTRVVLFLLVVVWLLQMYVLLQQPWSNMADDQLEKKPSDKMSLRTTGYAKVLSRRIPNVQIAGAPKAGTTALAEYLFRQDACRPIVPGKPDEKSEKESHFIDLSWGGLPYYQSHFVHCDKNARYLMDATPTTMLFPERVRRMYDQQGTADDVKFIFSLREPVSREISWYQHVVRMALGGNDTPSPWLRYLTPTFSSYSAIVLPLVELPLVRFTSIGLYAHWLRKWFHYFDRQQILIINYDDFKTNETDVYLRIHQFLGFPISGNLKGRQFNHQHVPTPPLDCPSQERWARRFEKPNQELYDLLEANPGPPMEKRPFKPFQFQCADGAVAQ